MFDLSSIEGTIRFAEWAHRGQVDKAGYPYILHPLRVGASLWRFSPDHVIAGILHDVIEDTRYDARDLRLFGASAAVVSAVEAVTKTESESRWEAYEVSIRRALADPVGAWVKAADIEDNANRLSGVPDLHTRDRLAEKYRRARWVLEDELDGYAPNRPLFPPDYTMASTH